MDKPLLIYIRAELNPNEYRCPIVPHDIKKLIEYGYIVYIESSTSRIYTNEEYIKNGAILTNKKWYSDEFNQGIIIGLKELSNLDKLNNHIHVYFSHSYKNQNNSNEILNSFKKSNSLLYDFEYFLNNENKRIIAFGFHAGYVGCCLGLLQHFTKKNTNNNISDLKIWNSCSELLNDVKKIYNKNIEVAIIGVNGKSGMCVFNILDYLGIKCSKYNRNDSKVNLERFDIIYNCIKLDVHLNEVWLDNTIDYIKQLTIVDISCDYTRNNNPIKIYNKSTTWEEPILSYNKYVDIIAIDNLPSLLPKDSSNEFSDNCTKLLLCYNNKLWESNKKLYYNIIKSIN